MLGLELQDARVVAVSVDERGVVQARAEVSAAGDLSSAAAAALDTVAASGRADTLGVATENPDSAAAAQVVPGLLQRRDGSVAYAGAWSSGICAALAEAWTGAAAGVPDVVYFSAGDHMTAGVVQQGKPVLGARGRAGNVAWLALNPVEREDYRKTGCLEAEVAAAGIVRRLIWRIKAGDRSRVLEMAGGDFAAITADHILTGARQNDGVSISVVRDTAKYLGMAAANLVALADPEMLVLGGIMASAADLLLEPVRVEIGRRVPKVTMDALTIATATLGADAAAIGAARFAAIARP
jgi:predicted NBD/HSP70 family sugar kinase